MSPKKPNPPLVAELPVPTNIDPETGKLAKGVENIVQAKPPQALSREERMRRIQAATKAAQTTDRSNAEPAPFDSGAFPAVDEAIEERIELPVSVKKPAVKPADKKSKKVEKAEEKSLVDMIRDLNEEVGKDRQISFRGDKNLLKELKYATFELEVSQQEFIIAAIRMLIEKVNDGESR